MDVIVDKSDLNKPEKLIESFPPIILDIWDYDTHMFMEDSKDYLCRACIHPKTASCRYVDS